VHSLIGLDLAKSVFQVHSVDAAGHAVLKRKLARGVLLKFFAKQSPCLVGNGGLLRCPPLGPRTGGDLKVDLARTRSPRPAPDSRYAAPDAPGHASHVPPQCELPPRLPSAVWRQSISRTRPVSASFLISSISAILSSVIVVSVQGVQVRNSNLKTKTDGGHPAGRVPLWISGPPPPDSGRRYGATYPQQSYTTTGNTVAGGRNSALGCGGFQSGLPRGRNLITFSRSSIASA
jgi:hypothetical protein